jgi:hypothetical protein
MGTGSNNERKSQEVEVWVILMVYQKKLISRKDEIKDMGLYDRDYMKSEEWQRRHGYPKGYNDRAQSRRKMLYYVVLPLLVLVIIIILMKIYDFNLKEIVEHIHREDLKPQDAPEVFIYSL